MRLSAGSRDVTSSELDGTLVSGRSASDLLFHPTCRTFVGAGEPLSPLRLFRPAGSITKMQITVRCFRPASGNAALAPFTTRQRVCIRCQTRLPKASKIRAEATPYEVRHGQRPRKRMHGRLICPPNISMNFTCRTVATIVVYQAWWSASSIRGSLGC